MKVKFISFVAVAFLLAFVSGCSRDGLSDLPEPTFKKLQNGMTLLILEDHSLPTFRLNIYHPAGSVFDPKGQGGLADLTAEVLRTGGTKKQTANDIENALAQLAASIEMGSGREEGWVSARCLKEDRTALLSLLAEMLQEPKFAPAAFEVAQQQALVSLARAQENPGSLASLQWPGVIYGPNNPWGQVPTMAGLQQMTPQDAETFYRQHFWPDRMFIAVTGDFQSDEVIKEINATLGQWKREASSPVQWPEIGAFKPKVKKIAMPSSQMAIRLGHQGGVRTDPDKFTLLVANYILGGSGSLTSRLGFKIRSQSGQAYAVWSQYRFRQVPGIFQMITLTEASQAEEVEKSMKTVLEKLQKTGATDEEVSDAKNAILRSILFDYESRAAINRDAAKFALWGYPRDYIQRLIKGIKKITVSDVNQVLKEKFHPDQLSVLQVGPQESSPTEPSSS